jgi:hypothetical protein
MQEAFLDFIYGSSYDEYKTLHRQPVESTSSNATLEQKEQSQLLTESQWKQLRYKPQSQEFSTSKDTRRNTAKENAEKEVITVAKEVAVEKRDVEIDSHVETLQEGVWRSALFGPPGKQVLALLMDSRYHRDPMPDFCSFSSTVDEHPPKILNEEQWQWLEVQLNQSQAQIHLLAAGFQILPDDKPIQEYW